MTTHILIVCTHNSARSVLAEGMLNHWAARLGVAVRGHSAGSAPSGRVNPHALAALQAAGVDTAGLHSKGWAPYTQPDAPALAAVITVCDQAAGEACPLFTAPAGVAPARAHWGYPDPSRAPEAERDQAFELTRQALGYRMLQLLALPLAGMARAELQAALAEIGRR
jgi:arsenate reductase